MSRATRIEASSNALDLSAEWDSPLYVFIDGIMEIISSPFDALFWLNNHWPRHISYPEEARLACYNALATDRGSEDARVQFIVACNKAGWDVEPENNLHAPTHQRLLKH
jgi:hypothetical protein